MTPESSNWVQDKWTQTKQTILISDHTYLWNYHRWVSWYCYFLRFLKFLLSKKHLPLPWVPHCSQHLIYEPGPIFSGPQLHSSSAPALLRVSHSHIHPMFPRSRGFLTCKELSLHLSVSLVTFLPTTTIPISSSFWENLRNDFEREVKALAIFYPTSKI